MTGTKALHRRRQVTESVLSPVASSHGLQDGRDVDSASSANDSQRRSSRGKRSLQSHQPVDQEQESARALMQLAQGGLGQVDEPQVPSGTLPALDHQPTTPPTNIRNVRSESHQRGQDRKRSRRYHKNDAVPLAPDEAQSIGLEYTDIVQSSTPDAKRDSTVSGDKRNARKSSSHLLDDVSTDDEVEDFAQATGESALYRSRSRTPTEAVGVDPRGDSHPQDSTPAEALYHDDQRMNLDAGVPTDRSQKGKKRRLDASIDANKGADYWARGTREEGSPPSLFVDQRRSQSPSEANREENRYTSRMPPHMVTGMPIDPTLDGSNSGLASGSRLPEHRSSGPHQSRELAEATMISDNSKFEEEDRPYFSPYQNAATYEQMALTERSGANQQANTVSKRFKATKNKDSNGLHVSALLNSHGRFGQAEIEKIERYRQKWCQRNGKQLSDFNSLVQSPIRGQPEAVAIFKEIQEMFPTQSPSYVQRFCRRKFHNFAARGTWTSAEDENLRKYVAEKGTSWKAVGEAMDRFPEDCRDRWRNYLVNQEHRNHEQWTDGEVHNLAAAILDCAQTKAAERQRQASDHQQVESYIPSAHLDLSNLDMKLVNWQSVSDRMGSNGGGRSRLQCSFKWNKIRAEDRFRFLQQAQSAQQHASNGIVDATGENVTMSKGWRASLARKKVSNMLTGDKMDLLRGVITSGAVSEAHIPWKAIGPEWFQRTWNVAEKKAAWVLLKETYPFGEEDDYRAIADYLLRDQRATEANEHWDPSPWEEERARQRALNPQRGGYRPRRRPKSPIPTAAVVEPPSEVSQGTSAVPVEEDSSQAISHIDLTGDPDGEPSPPRRHTRQQKNSGNQGLDPQTSAEDVNVGPELASQIMSLRNAA